MSCLPQSTLTIINMHSLTAPRSVSFNKSSPPHWCFQKVSGASHPCHLKSHLNTFLFYLSFLITTIVTVSLWPRGTRRGFKKNVVWCNTSGGTDMLWWCIAPSAITPVIYALQRNIGMMLKNEAHILRDCWRILMKSWAESLVGFIRRHRRGKAPTRLQKPFAKGGFGWGSPEAYHANICLDSGQCQESHCTATGTARHSAWSTSPPRNCLQYKKMGPLCIYLPGWTPSCQPQN